MTRTIGIYTLALLFLLCSLAAGQQQEADDKKNTQDKDDQEVSLEQLLDAKISADEKYEYTISDAPTSVAIITSEDIERFGYRTLAEALMQLPGFYVTNDRVYSYLGTRGFSRPSDYNSRVLVLINGHILNEAVFGSASMGFDLGIDLMNVERIEVIQGPGTVLFGTGAMYAVINIIIKKGNAIDGFLVNTELGNQGYMRGAATFGKQFGESDFLLAVQGTDIRGPDLFFEEFNNAQNNNGIAKGMDWEESTGLFTTFSFRNLTLTTLMSYRRKGEPTGAFEIAFNDRRAEVQDLREFIEYRYDLDFDGNKHLLLRGYMDFFEHERFYPFNRPGNQRLFYEESESYRYGQEVQFRWDISSNNRLTIGAEYINVFRAKIETKDESITFISGDFPFDITSFYFQDEFQITETLSLMAGFRSDNYTDMDTFISPRYALIYHPFTKSTFKFLYSEAFRAPNIFENHFLRGQKMRNLERELIEVFEAIWEQHFSDEFSFVMSVYNYELEDIIEKLFAQQLSPEGVPIFESMRMQGIQIGLNARFGNGVAGYANYSYQKSKVVPKVLKLSNSPDHIVKGGISVPVAKGFFTSFEFDYETSRSTLLNKRSDGFLVANLAISTTRFSENATVSLIVRNLFNKSFETPGGFEHIQDAIIQNGRTITFSLKYHF